MYMHDVDEICHVILNRIAYQGVFITNTSLCTEAPIKSTLGTTLRELYFNYNLIDENRIIIERHALSAIGANVIKYCSRGFKILESIDMIFPPLKYTNCFLHHFRLLNNQVCLPLQPPYIGRINITDTNMDICIYQLEKLSAQHEVLRQTEQTITQLPGLLAVEISRVWRYQMTEWLHSHQLEFKASK